MDIIKTIEETQKRVGAQGFNVGDTVKVYFKIKQKSTNKYVMKTTLKNGKTILYW